MLAKDANDFRRFVENLNSRMPMGSVTEEAATAYVRDICRVESRSEIKPGTEAGNRLDLLESAFICWRDKYKFIEAAE